MSYSHNDKPAVRRLAERLKNDGKRVWFDEWVVKPGKNIYLAVEKGLQESRKNVFVMSPNSINKEWTDAERSTILFIDPSNKQERFIPLKLEECEIPDTLKPFMAIDYLQENENGYKILLECLEDIG